MLLDLMGTFAMRRRFAEVAGDKGTRRIELDEDEDDVIAMVLTQAAIFYYWTE